MLLALGAAGALGACASKHKDRGICDTGLCRASSAAANGGLGKNETSFTLRGGNAIPGATGGSSGGAGAGGSGGSSACGTGSKCKETWKCTPWQTATMPKGTLPTGDNAGTRTCTDICSCGTTANKPVEQADLPPLDFDFYRCEVEPFLDGSCAQLACHGKEEGHALRIYARSKLRITGETWISNVCGDKNKQIKSESCIGSNECQCWQLPHSDLEWQRNYDAVRGFALDPSGQLYSDVTQSELLLQGLGLSMGGLPHGGVQLYLDSSSSYRDLRDWLSAAGTGSGCLTRGQETN
ncbi:MAG TPA: hypothetical protein VHM19_16440 [Polyangiales bacterium]|jgi:hypothetical protein|nr:hypothetical protein [Polyangiales bacterium]